MTPDQLANLLRLVADLYGQLAAVQQEAARLAAENAELRQQAVPPEEATHA